MSTNSYVNAASDGRPGGPLLFLFHGTGGDEHQFEALGRDLVPEAFLISPRGDVSEAGALRFFRRTAEGVYDMADLARATEKMAGFMQAHIDRVKPSAVMGLGYSNGANILASVLFAYPGLVHAAALMHPLIPFDPDPRNDLAASRVLITAGRRDPICPPGLTSRLEERLRDRGAAVTLEWHDGGHEIRPNEIAAVKSFLSSSDAGVSTDE